MNYQPVADDQIAELIRAYSDLRSLPDLQNEAFDQGHCTGIARGDCTDCTGPSI